MDEVSTVYMTLWGWVFMSASWLAITSLVAFCMGKVIASKATELPGETPLD